MVIEKNKAPTITEEGKLSYSAYWNTGTMLILREALDADHPEHLYNYLKRFDIMPEDWGVKAPLDELIESEYAGMSREELIIELVKAKKDIDSLYRAGY